MPRQDRTQLGLVEEVDGEGMPSIKYDIMLTLYRNVTIAEMLRWTIYFYSEHLSTVITQAQLFLSIAYVQ